MDFLMPRLASVFCLGSDYNVSFYSPLLSFGVFSLLYPRLGRCINGEQTVRRFVRTSTITYAGFLVALRLQSPVFFLFFWRTTDWFHYMLLNYWNYSLFQGVSSYFLQRLKMNNYLLTPWPHCKQQWVPPFLRWIKSSTSGFWDGSQRD